MQNFSCLSLHNNGANSLKNDCVSSKFSCEPNLMRGKLPINFCFRSHNFFPFLSLALSLSPDSRKKCIFLSCLIFSPSTCFVYNICANKSHLIPVDLYTTAIRYFTQPLSSLLYVQGNNIKPFKLYSEQPMVFIIFIPTIKKNVAYK